MKSNKTVLDYLKIEDLRYPWNVVAEKIGLENVKILFKSADVIPQGLYIPNYKRKKELLIRLVQDNFKHKSAQEISWELEISLPLAYEVLRKAREKNNGNQPKLF